MHRPRDCDLCGSAEYAGAIADPRLWIRRNYSASVPRQYPIRGAAGNTLGRSSITADELYDVIRSERLPGAAGIR